MYGFDGYGEGCVDLKSVKWLTMKHLLHCYKAEMWSIGYWVFFLKDPPNLGKPSLLQFLPNLESILKHSLAIGLLHYQKALNDNTGIKCMVIEP